MRKYLGVAAALSVLILSLCSPVAVHADVNNFTITDFNATYKLTHDDPQGALTIDEHIGVDFTYYNHGILRAIPEAYNGHPLHVKVSKVLFNGSREQYTHSTQNGNYVLKIGDPNLTVSGPQNYEIVYSVVNVMRIVGNHDELDWNVNGTEWQQPFEQVQAKLSAPFALNATPTCFTGSYGSTTSDCTVAVTSDTTTFTAARHLQAGETMTFRADYPLGTFSAYTFKDWLADYKIQLIEAIGLPLAVFILAFGYWFKNGRDLKGRGTIIPEYTPPEGLGPLGVDVIEHYKLGTKAISATIIDLAIRKYIRIIESEAKALLGTKKTYSLQLLTTDFSKLNGYEQQILAPIFGGELQTVDLNSLKNKFYLTAQSLQKSLPQDLTAQGYFTRNPRRAGNAVHVIGAVAVFGGFYVFQLSIALAFGVIISGLMLFLFASLMPRRTQKGVDAKDMIEGLKLYMNVAEKDRIAMLQSPDAPYAPQSDAPQQTVELFEKLLPYAMILGVENQWAKKFDGIYTTPPDWYSGNWTAFSAGYLVGSLNDSMAVMGTSFAAPASSGSGSGGGFSGGGGGGGGGGGW